MKKVLSLTMLALTVLTIAGCARGYESCETPDGTQACFNKDAGQFRWEEGAVVEIGVDSDSMGAALVEKWNADFPELAGKLVFRKYDSANGDSSGVAGVVAAQGEAPDVVLVIDNEVVGNTAAFLPLHEFLTDTIKENSLTAVTDIINNKSTVYSTAFYDGMAFSWNKTMFEEMGLDTTDENGDNLPDAYDTWEEIFELDVNSLPEYKGNKILEVFPISIDEPWSGYSSLTAEGFNLFGSGDLAKPGFETEEFKQGLEFIKTFSEQGINIDETGTKKSASSMGWRWDAFLNDEAYLFGLVGTWIDVNGAEQSNNADFKFASMPTWNENNLSPLMKTKGFVINGYTENPSAASEVLRWLYTQETMTEMISNSSYLPALQESGSAYPTVNDENKAEFGLAFINNQMEPAGSLPNNPAMRAMNVYYSIDITSFYKAIWDGTMSPEEAQDAIVSAANAWIEENNKTE
ncbi:extracellular solute-binding protein [Mycoplasmatota bacterium WC44]